MTQDIQDTFLFSTSLGCRCWQHRDLGPAWLRKKSRVFHYNTLLLQRYIWRASKIWKVRLCPTEDTKEMKKNQCLENQRCCYVRYSSYGLTHPSAHSIQMQAIIFISLFTRPPFSSEKKNAHQSPRDHGWNLNAKKLWAMITLTELTSKGGKMEMRQVFLLTTALTESMSLWHVSFLHLPKQNVWKKQSSRPFIWILGSCSVQPRSNLSLILCKSSVNSQGKGFLFSQNGWEVILCARYPEQRTYKNVRHVS